ncbi:hypothetical protein AUJ68_05600 [Candidatus Woesearchaeota archaeon CG1_02_57_44]|nr:MAG: hypothetical protein AUJ68_05600 [Candidatus Woesearchaeota archaeon CG1_02_57_44]PIN69268.1 MAG: UDP-glucose 4-epimerase [Candidatus Woesearchaeota archaeon CG11_big_fil_rev_8_21_14_0_20_57_5]
MRVVLTGGAGFIGSHIAEALLRQGHTVLIIDDLSTGQRDFISKYAKFVQASILDPACAKAIASFHADAIVHQAAQIDVAKSMQDPASDIKVNFSGTLAILEAARPNKTPIVFASSAAVYGDNPDIPLCEDADTYPISTYGVSKLSSELICKAYERTHGVPCVALRYSNVYGPRQATRGEGGVVSVFIRALLQDKVPTIYGTGEQTRDFVYVEDVADANMAALSWLLKNRHGAVVNVSTGRQTSIIDLHKQVAKRMSSSPACQQQPVMADTRAGDIMHSSLDPTKAQGIFEWQAATALSDGLRHTISYFRAQADGREGDASKRDASKGDA